MLVLERTMGLSFGEVVRRRRMELGLTQEELGARFGRDSTRVSKVESGHTFRRLPDVEEFLEWAEALELDPALILEQMGYIKENEGFESRPAELVFTSLADEVRYASNMPADVQEAMLDGIKHARRLWEAKRGR